MKKVIILITVLVLSFMLVGCGGTDPYSDSYLFIECELNSTIELADAGSMMDSSSDIAYSYDAEKMSIVVNSEVNEFNLNGMGKIGETDRAILGLTMTLKFNDETITGNMLTTPETLDKLIAESGMESFYTLKPLFGEYGSKGELKVSLNNKELKVKPTETVTESEEYENHTIDMAGMVFPVDYLKNVVVVKNIGFVKKEAVVFK